jgi:hypothetical protein
VVVEKETRNSHAIWKGIIGRINTPCVARGAWSTMLVVKIMYRKHRCAKADIRGSAFIAVVNVVVRPGLVDRAQLKVQDTV